MKYKIMEIVKPEILNNLLIKDRFEEHNIHSILKDVDIYSSKLNSSVKIIHNSIEEAYDEIVKHKDVLKQMKLTIIPIIRIDYEGEIL
jgi:hypothetical protein